MGIAQQGFEGSPEEGGEIGVLEGDNGYFLIGIVQRLERDVEIGNVVIEDRHKVVLLGDQIFNDSHYVLTVWHVSENGEGRRGALRLRGRGIAAMHGGRRGMGRCVSEGCRRENDSLGPHRHFDFVQQAHPLFDLAFCSQARYLQSSKGRLLRVRYLTRLRALHAGNA